VCREYSEYVYVNDESGPAMSVVPTRKMEKVPKCGIVDTTLIVGGARVNNELEFPHMVSIIITANLFGFSTERTHPMMMMMLVYEGARVKLKALL